eukprot:CAMPEP_0168337676 /NCGR_PEP_ID=MMETSP0213-20121227/12343_1 /TAXON_ID=151035 /ORGANISM="Euplotes harpa, Strain FSP1.4" /LENGTH=195 /DNA_ID=CAMNT_0008343233 /DNA_START=26 /DNA_END=610 /DNA_ORIENTATION=-
MSNFSTYKLENWKSPEMLFSGEYKEFNLFRDINAIYDSDFESFDCELPFLKEEVRDGSNGDEEKEDVKADFFASTQGFCNMNTTSDIEEATVQVEDLGNYVKIPNFDGNGQMITVTKKRMERILKQRSKRREFLKLFPEYAKPFSERSKSIKYKTRSEMAKNRKRNGLGKFSKLKVTVNLKINASEVTTVTKTKW